jgi:ribosomal protein S18 acetylase RimI-like enzyme
MTEATHKIVRANTLQDLEKAFSCGLIQVYQDIFADPPYEEHFSSDFVAKMFTTYFDRCIENKVLLFSYVENEVVAFCSAVPLSRTWLDFEIFNENSRTSHNCYEYFQEVFNATCENTWYLDDLGVRKDQRRKGLAKRLLQNCLSTLGSVNVFLRTSDSNSSARLLYKGLGFNPVDEISVSVCQERQDGTTREDRRILMIKSVKY